MLLKPKLITEKMTINFLKGHRVKASGDGGDKQFELKTKTGENVTV